MSRLGRLEVRGGLLAALDRDLVADALTLGEGPHASAFDGADVDEDVTPAIARLDEAEALDGVEPLDGTGSHISLLGSSGSTHATGRNNRPVSNNLDLGVT